MASWLESGLAKILNSIEAEGIAEAKDQFAGITLPPEIKEPIVEPA